MRISINGSIAKLILLSGIAGIGCRTSNNSGLSDGVSLEGVRGYSNPGKGFKLLTREVTESVCVSGDEGSPNDRVGSPITPDTTVKPTPTRDPGFPDVPGVPSNPNNPNPGTPDPGNPDPGLPPPFFPDTTINPTNPDPYSGSPFGVRKINNFQSVQKPMAASRTNVDAVISPAKSAAPTKHATSLALSSQSGGAAVEFYFLESTHDVRRVITLSLNGDAGVGGGVAAANAELGANFEAQLTSSKLNSSQYVYILIHGKKTYPVIGSDVITNPTINPKLTKVLFNDAIPKTEEEIVASYNTFRKQCGDYFIETVVRGREVWMVAAFDKNVFNKTTHGSFSFGTRVNGPASSTADAAVKTANAKLGGGITYDKSDNLMKQTATIFVRTIGRTDFTIGNFTLEDAMERLNKVLAADNSEGEGAIELETRPYNNVRLVIGDEEKRLGDIFTAEIERKAGGMDAFKKLADAKAWATRQAKYLEETYKWDQWSLDPKVYNGVARQYKNLVSYADLIDGVFKQCPAGNRELTSASAECIKLANKIAALNAPVVNPPPVLNQQLVFYMPEELRTLVDTKGWQSDAKGVNQFQQADARARCEKLGMALPNRDNWRKIVENSLFYLRWKVSENAAYRPASDADSLMAYPCAKFEGANFWAEEAGQVVQIPVECSAAAVATSPVPNLSKYKSWPKLLSRYVCVNFVPRNQQ